MKNLKNLFKWFVLLFSCLVFLISAIFLNSEGTTWGNSVAIIGCIAIIPAFVAMLKIQLGYFSHLMNSLVGLVCIAYTAYSYFESQKKIIWRHDFNRS